ncbi:MAG: Gfo/Idh/MocA family protein [Woeseiaceae bacterium]
MSVPLKPPLKVALVGFGRMGRRHAVVYDSSEKFELVAICGREHQIHDVITNHASVRFLSDFEETLAEMQPDLVCISTHIDTHDEYARKALARGCHVFLEKPATVSHATTRKLIDHANTVGLKLIIGYILHHDRLWTTFIEECRKRAGPLEIEIQLDQHSEGEEWAIHQKILRDSSIAFDCGIHFFDIMTQAIELKPTTVNAVTSNTHGDKSLNDNSLSTTLSFADGSTGTYISSWGPGFQAEPLSKIEASGRDGMVSIVEDGDRSEVLVKRHDGSVRLAYADSLHLQQATTRQQEFVFDCIVSDIDLAEHHDRTLLSMKTAEEVDIAASQRVDGD